MLQVWCPRCAVPVPHPRHQVVPRQYRHPSGAVFRGPETHVACDTPVCLAPDPLPPATPELNAAMPRVGYVTPSVPSSGVAVTVYAANTPGTQMANGHVRNCVPLESEDVYMERTGRVLRPGHQLHVPSNCVTTGLLVVPVCGACANATLRIWYDLDTRTLQVPTREFCWHMHEHSSDTHGMAVAICVAWKQCSARFLWHVWTDDNNHIVQVLAFGSETITRIPGDPAITCIVSADCTGIAATHPAHMHPVWREHVAQRAMTRELQRVLTPPVLDDKTVLPSIVVHDALQPAEEPPAGNDVVAPVVAVGNGVVEPVVAAAADKEEAPSSPEKKNRKRKREKGEKPRFRIVLNTDPAEKKPRTE